MTRLITLVHAITRRMGIQTPADADLPELERDVAPEQVLDKIDQTKDRLDKEGGGGRAPK